MFSGRICQLLASCRLINKQKSEAISFRMHSISWFSMKWKYPVYFHRLGTSASYFSIYNLKTTNNTTCLFLCRRKRRAFGLIIFILDRILTVSAVTPQHFRIRTGFTECFQFLHYNRQVFLIGHAKPLVRRMKDGDLQSVLLH